MVHADAVFLAPRQGGDQPHSEAGAVRRIETRGEASAFVRNRDLDPAGHDRRADDDAAAPVFQGIRDQFRGDQPERGDLVRLQQDRRDPHLHRPAFQRIGHHRHHVVEQAAQIAGRIGLGNGAAFVEAPMNRGDREDAGGRLFERGAGFGVVQRARLELEHGSHQLQAVLHAMMDLLHQQVLVAQQGILFPQQIVTRGLPPLHLERGAQRVGQRLQERHVLVREIGSVGAVAFEDAEWLAAAGADDDVDGAPDAVVGQQGGRAEPCFLREMVGDDRLGAAECIAGRAFEVRADRCLADDAGVPADAGADQEDAVRGDVFEDLGEAGFQPLRGHHAGFIQDGLQAVALHREQPEFGDKLLLPQAQGKLGGGQPGGGKGRHVASQVRESTPLPRCAGCHYAPDCRAPPIWAEPGCRPPVDG